MKVTFKNGTVIEDVAPADLPFVLAMGDPAVAIAQVGKWVQGELKNLAKVFGLGGEDAAGK